MALVRQAQYDVRGNSEEGTRSSDGYVDTSTGEIFRGQRVGDSENGYEYVTVPTGQTWDKMNKADPSGRNIYGSQGYAPEQYTSEGDESYGTSYTSSHVGGLTPSGDMQIAESMDRKGYTDVLAKYGITPKYDPKYGYVLPANVHNAVTQEYFKSAGLGQYQEKGFINKLLDDAVPIKLAMSAFLGPMAGEVLGAASSGLGLPDVTGGFNTALGTALEGLPTDVIKGITDAAGAAGKNALTSGINAAMSGQDPLEAAIKGGAFTMLGGGISNSLVNAGINSTISNSVSQAVTQLVKNGTISPEALLAGAVSGEANKELLKVLKDFDIPKSMIPTITQAVNQVVMTGEVNPTKLFTSAAMNAINSGFKTGSEAGSGVVTANEKAAATVAAEPPPTNVSTNTANTNANVYAGTSTGTTTDTVNTDALELAKTKYNKNLDDIERINGVITKEEANYALQDAAGMYGVTTDQLDSFLNEGGFGGVYGSTDTETTAPTAEEIAAAEAEIEEVRQREEADARGEADVKNKEATEVIPEVTSEVKPEPQPSDNFIDPNKADFRMPVTDEEKKAYQDFADQTDPTKVEIIGGEYIPDAPVVPAPEDDFEPYVNPETPLTPAPDQGGVPTPPPVDVPPEPCQLPFVDDGTGRCILPEDKEKEDTPIPDCGPGMIWSFADNACVPVTDITPPVVTPVIPKPPVTPPPPPPPPPKTTTTTTTTPGSGFNPMLAFLLGSAGNQGQPPAPTPEQAPVTITPYELYALKNDLYYGADDAEQAKPVRAAAGGSVHAINEELLKILRS